MQVADVVVNATNFGTFLTFFSLFLIFKRWNERRFRRLHLPPGPPGWPIVGNIDEVSNEYGWLGYASMAKKYGNIMYLEALGKPMLVLGTFQQAIDFLEKRSSNTSDRPRSTMMLDLLGLTWNTGLMPYGDAWRQRRRVLQNYFHHNATKDYRSTQIRVVHCMLKDFLDDPSHFPDHVRKFTTWIILNTVYGHDVESFEDPLVSMVESSLSKFNRILERGIHPVDIFPLMKYIPIWFPGAHFRRVAEEVKIEMLAARDTAFEEAKSRMGDGTASPCLATHYLDELQQRNDDALPADQEGIIRDAAGVAYGAGVDTTMSSLMTFILAMMHYPEVQKKAQAELDSVVGVNSLPTFEHLQDLPYAKHVLWETLRWQPATPMGLPHATISEDIYDGYRIPAGTLVRANIWAILHDDEVYPNPEVFNPDRYYEGSPDPSAAAFGFGRRICPGRHLAMNTIWIAIVSLLSTFTIEEELDKSGNEIASEIAYTTGAVSYPKPFKCRFTPRSANIRKLLESQA